jgi:hypothetical protein
MHRSFIYSTKNIIIIDLDHSVLLSVVNNLFQVCLELKQLLLFEDLAYDELCGDFRLLKILRLVIFNNMFF